jgi:hypothetical protein
VGPIVLTSKRAFDMSESNRGRKRKNIALDDICDTLKLSKFELVAKLLGVSRAYIYRELKEAGLYERYSIRSRRKNTKGNSPGPDMCDVPILR